MIGSSWRPIPRTSDGKKKPRYLKRCGALIDVGQFSAAGPHLFGKCQ